MLPWAKGPVIRNNDLSISPSHFRIPMMKPFEAQNDIIVFEIQYAGLQSRVEGADLVRAFYAFRRRENSPVWQLDREGVKTSVCIWVQTSRILPGNEVSASSRVD